MSHVSNEVSPINAKAIEASKAKREMKEKTDKLKAMSPVQKKTFFASLVREVNEENGNQAKLKTVLAENGWFLAESSVKQKIAEIRSDLKKLVEKAESQGKTVSIDIDSVCPNLPSASGTVRNQNLTVDALCDAWGIVSVEQNSQSIGETLSEIENGVDSSLAMKDDFDTEGENDSE